jgi:hypothetical protein
MTTPLPNPLELANLFGELFDRGVTATASPLPKPDAARFAIAEFHGGDDEVKVVACCDGPLGASLAAALTIMPAGRVDEWLRETPHDEMMVSNLYETFNVLAAIFPKVGGPRMVLRNVVYDNKPSPRASEIVKAPAKKAEYEMNVSGYKKGRIAIYAA